MLEKDELGAETKASKQWKKLLGGGLETEQGTEKGLGKRLNKLFAV